MNAVRLLSNSLNILMIVGCDAGVGEDIWVLSRPLGQVSMWFPTPTPTPLWRAPFPLALRETKISSPIIISDENNRFFAFWNLEDRMSIRHARRSGEEVENPILAWSNEAVVIETLSGQVEQPAAAIDNRDGLALVWNTGSEGEIQFSSVSLGLSLFSGEWTNPINLPLPRSGASAPNILAAPNGDLYVSYAITVNEMRGIYFTKSIDSGGTWSDPKIVFNAEALDWAMVDEPTMARTEDGRLHMLWWRYVLTGSETGAPTAEGIYYASSGNDGENWSNPEPVTVRTPYWAGLLTVDNSTIFRLWSDENNDRRTLWYQVSNDSGLSWTEVARVSDYGNETSLVSVLADPSGKVHTLQVRIGATSAEGETLYAIQHLIWNGQGWTLVETFNIGTNEVQNWDSAISSLGTLGTLYVSQGSDPAGQLFDTLLFTDRVLDLEGFALQTPTPAPILISTGEAPSTDLTPTIQPSATVFFPTSEENNNIAGLSGDFYGLLLGIIPAGLIIFLVLVIGRRLTRR